MLNDEGKAASKKLYKILGDDAVLTVAKMETIAKECQTSYKNIVKKIQRCRAGGIHVEQCVLDIIESYSS